MRLLILARTRVSYTEEKKRAVCSTQPRTHYKLQSFSVLNVAAYTDVLIMRFKTRFKTENDDCRTHNRSMLSHLLYAETGFSRFNLSNRSLQ